MASLDEKVLGLSMNRRVQFVRKGPTSSRSLLKLSGPSTQGSQTSSGDSLGGDRWRRAINTWNCSVMEANVCITFPKQSKVDRRGREGSCTGSNMARLCCQHFITQHLKAADTQILLGFQQSLMSSDFCPGSLWWN